MRPTTFILAAALLPSTGDLAAAQQSEPSPPSRIGSEWDNRDHQPTAAEVQRLEQSAGIAPSATTRQQHSDEIQELDRQIQNQAQQDLRTNPSP